MDEIESSSATKPRTSQACQRCRSLKTRCLPSEQPGTCQRCVNTKRECNWADAPRRARKLRTPSRISQVEQKIDGLVASLQNPSLTRDDTDSIPAEPCPVSHRIARRGPDHRPIAPGNWLPFPTSFTPDESPAGQDAPKADQDTEIDGQYLEKLRSIHNFSDKTDLSRLPDNVFHTSAVSEPVVDHDILKHLFSSGEAETLLNDYRTMSTSFPFVPIPAETTAQELFRAKPMLLLAILTAASFQDHQRQMTLDKLYRTELATRTIIRPRRTLALLQSVLVYLSWYHFMFSHKTQQIYFLQQVSVGLALEFGLHRKSKGRTFGFIGQTKPQPSQQENLERQRTYLGCYFLSSLISGGLQKPNLLKYTEYMGQCSQNLESTQEYPSDCVLAHLISLRRLDDQIHEMFYSDDTIDKPITDPRILMNLRFMESQLEATKGRSFGDEFQRTLALSHSYTDMQLHAIALRTRESTSQYSDANPDNVQFNSLLSALEAGKRFLDDLLLFPATAYHLIPFTEWMRVPMVIITMARLCIPSDAHTAAQWDVKTAQERVRLDLCMESLCYRMQGLSTYDPVKQPHHDFWWAMRMIMDLTRTWYCRKIAPKKDTSPASGVNDGSLPTPDESLESGMSMAGVTPADASSSHNLNGQFFGMGGMGTANMDINMDMNQDEDIFAFMRDADFDMGQFVDAGIWDDELYFDMGFGAGGGARTF